MINNSTINCNPSCDLNLVGAVLLIGHYGFGAFGLPEWVITILLVWLFVDLAFVAIGAMFMGLVFFVDYAQRKDQS